MLNTPVIPKSNAVRLPFEANLIIWFGAVIIQECKYAIAFGFWYVVDVCSECFVYKD